MPSIITNLFKVLISSLYSPKQLCHVPVSCINKELLFSLLWLKSFHSYHQQCKLMYFFPKTSCYLSYLQMCSYPVLTPPYSKLYSSRLTTTAQNLVDAPSLPSQEDYLGDTTRYPLPSLYVTNPSAFLVFVIFVLFCLQCTVCFQLKNVLFGDTERIL